MTIEAATPEPEPDKLGTFLDYGSKLRELREKKGISLDVLIDETKIGRNYLQEIEAGEWEKLPGGAQSIFTRGFVKAYCQVIDVEPQEFLEPIKKPVYDPRQSLDRTNQIVYAQNQYQESWLSKIQNWRHSQTLIYALPLFAFLIIVPIYAYYQRNAADVPPAGDQFATPSPALSSIPQDANLSQTNDPLNQGAAGPTSATADALRMQFYFESPCWLEVQADGKQLAYRLMQKGETFEVAADSEIILGLGAPDSARCYFNGIRLDFGRRTPFKDLRLNRENWRSYQAQRP